MKFSKTFLSKNFWSYSKTVVLACILFISIFRLSNVNKNETSWDVLGYYLPLPATFIHHDPTLKSIDWIKEANKDQQLTDTYYQLGVNKEGEPIYFFLFGMAIFMLPFFFLGHASAYIFGFPMDGFSEPYQYCLVIGGVVYTIIGLFFLRKILRHFFNELIAACVILIIVFATNYSNHLTLKNLETVNVLFMLMCILLWSTIQWHTTQKLKHIIAIALSVALMTLVKPSEVFSIFIPLLWNVFSVESLKQKAALIWKYKTQVIIAASLSILIFVPQLYYWYKKTGQILFDSYQNAGVGLDFTHPHILDVLFSYKKGWLIYTPVIILSLIGFYFLFRKHKQISFALLFYFLLSFYVLSSWTEWWYGAAFSCRPIITAYPILAIALGAFLLQIHTNAARISVLVFVFLCTFLNQFQWWQLRNYILDPVRTTKAYYWATFLKTSIPQNAEELKSVSYVYDPLRTWPDKNRYKKTKEFQVTGSAPNFSSEEFSSIKFRVPYNKLTKKDHLWFTISMTLAVKDTAFSNGPFLVATAMYKDKAYGYLAPHLNELRKTNSDGKMEIFMQCMSPPIRTENDEISIYLWNPGKYKLGQSNFKVKIFERKGN